MMGIDWLKPAVFFGSMLYAVIGVLVFWLCFLIVDKLTPTSCGKRSSSTRTWPWPSSWARCAIAIGLIVSAAVHG